MESLKNKEPDNKEIEDILLTNAQSNYNGNLKEIIYINFMFEIGNYLIKNEKIALRQVSKHFAYNVFPLFSIFLNMKNKHDMDDYLPKKFVFENIFKNFCSVDKVNLEYLYINKEILKGLSILFHNNSNKIKTLFLTNLEYQGTIAISELHILFNKLANLEEIKIANVGNRDKSFINSERNFINLNMFKKVKTLKIDNIPLKQTLYFINSFENIENLSIENCSLDEDLSQIDLNINRKNRKIYNLKSLNLSLNGLSSQTAMESLKKIIINQKNLECLILRGMWFQEIYPLSDVFKVLDKLYFLDLTGSKNIFNGLNSINAIGSLKNIRILNLEDSRMEDEDLLKLLQIFKEKNYKDLQELNLIRCLLTDDSINNILDYEEILPHLRILNFNFNHRITEKGFNKYLDNFKKLKSLKILNLRNTGISLKYSLKNICNFILALSLDKQSNLIANMKDKIYQKSENIKKDMNYELFNKSNNAYAINNIMMTGVSSEDEIFCSELNLEDSPTKYTELIGNYKKTNSAVLDISSEKHEKIDINTCGNLEILELYFCTLYDNDYYSLFELILNKLKENNICNYINLKIGLKIFNNKKPIFKKIEKLQSDLYKNYNLIIK